MVIFFIVPASGPFSLVILHFPNECDFYFEVLSTPIKKQTCENEI